MSVTPLVSSCCHHTWQHLHLHRCGWMLWSIKLCLISSSRLVVASSSAASYLRTLHLVLSPLCFCSRAECHESSLLRLEDHPDDGVEKRRDQCAPGIGDGSLVWCDTTVVKVAENIALGRKSKHSLVSETWEKTKPAKSSSGGKTESMCPWETGYNPSSYRGGGRSSGRSSRVGWMCTVQTLDNNWIVASIVLLTSRPDLNLLIITDHKQWRHF